MIKVAAATDSTGHVELFALGLTGDLWHRTETGVGKLGPWTGSSPRFR